MLLCKKNYFHNKLINIRVHSISAIDLIIKLIELDTKIRGVLYANSNLEY